MRASGKALTAVAITGFVATGLGPSLPAAVAASPVTVTVATVNNPDMTVMEQLTKYFERSHPGIRVQYVTLPDNILRQKVTLDAATGAGKYDVVTIGPYEVQSTWAKNHWLRPLGALFRRLPASKRRAYDLSDLIRPIRAAVTYQGHLYALPFYGESSMIYYRKDLFSQAHLTMPLHPTWSQIASLANKLNDPSKGIYGIVLKGTPEYGQLAPLLTVINAFGARWFNRKWQPQLTSPAFERAVSFYVHLLHRDGEPGAIGVGFNHGEALMAQGKAAIWYDATVAAGYLNDPKLSKVVGKIGYAFAPCQVTCIGSHWLYTWALGIDSASLHPNAAFQFIRWATSPAHTKLVASHFGWGVVAPGTRYSLYHDPNYVKVAPWAAITLQSIDSANINRPTLPPVPYTGLAQIDIPPFAAFASDFGQDFGAMVARKMTVKAALAKAQAQTVSIMKQAGYLK